MQNNSCKVFSFKNESVYLRKLRKRILKIFGSTKSFRKKLLKFVKRYGKTSKNLGYKAITRFFLKEQVLQENEL